VVVQLLEPLADGVRCDSNSTTNNKASHMMIQGREGRGSRYAAAALLRLADRNNDPKTLRMTR
jgi:hypothetical protein